MRQWRTATQPFARARVLDPRYTRIIGPMCSLCKNLTSQMSVSSKAVREMLIQINKPKDATQPAESNHPERTAPRGSRRLLGAVSYDWRDEYAARTTPTDN